MSFTRRHLLGAATAAALGASADGAISQTNAENAEKGIAIQPGPFSARDESFRSYTSPEWFQDAKFGIWAHWGPSSAIGDGDWYARNMYIQGNPQYEYHLKTYGHPSNFGYKDTIPLWKAERFDPKALIRLYKEAGARYFVSMGVHCDNFDLWNSKNHRWNSARMGPRRDIVGEWRDATRAAGLRFGVSEHVWGSYNWWQTNKGSDNTGPYAGIPYDGVDPANQDLYFPAHLPAKQAWAEQGNEPESWKREWFLRAQDLIDQHQPDLYYEDGAIPFGVWGRSLVAHYYNQSLRWHSGKLDVVYTGKSRREAELGACTLDVERGVTDDIEPRPFQTDTCIGVWHYKRGIAYKSPKRVIDMLVDVVSRNGNLLLNIPLPASGMPDDEELQILSEITKWMGVNGEAIFETRPWKVFGEGPSTQKSTTGAGQGRGMNGTAEHFNERTRKDLTAADIRFTTKSGALYAFVMGQSPSETRIASLSPSRGLETRKITNVQLLGSSEPISWKLSVEGLAVAAPRLWPADHAVVFKILFT